MKIWWIRSKKYLKDLSTGTCVRRRALSWSLVPCQLDTIVRTMKPSFSCHAFPRINWCALFSVQQFSAGLPWDGIWAVPSHPTEMLCHPVPSHTPHKQNLDRIKYAGKLSAALVLFRGIANVTKSMGEYHIIARMILGLFPALPIDGVLVWA